MWRRWRSSRSAVSAVLALTLLAGTCERRGDDGPREGPSARPRTGATIRLAYPAEPDSLNPVTDRTPAAGDILRAVLPTFFTVTPDLEYRPSLLAEMPAVRRAEGRMVVSFRIRGDATWSDGSPITVADVAFTRRATLAIGPADRGFRRLRRVVEVSATEGRLVIAPPLADWQELFAVGRFVLPAHAAESPREVGRWDGGPPVAGGPFTIGGWTRGRSVLLEPNPRHWNPPRSGGIEVLFVPSPTTAVQLLGAGRLDAVAPMLGVSWRRRLEAVEGVEVASATGGSVVSIVVDPDSVPSVGERRRILGSVDRERFLEVVVQDDGEPANGLSPPAEAGPWAGTGEGRPEPIGVEEELDLVFGGGEVISLLARYVQEEAERAGGDLDLLGLDEEVFQRTFLPDRRFDLAIWEMRTGPASRLRRWFADGDPFAMEIGGPPTEEGLAAAAVVLPVYRPAATMAWRSGVGGIRPNGTVDGPLWNAAAWSVTG